MENTYVNSMSNTRHNCVLSSHKYKASIVIYNKDKICVVSNKMANTKNEQKTIPVSPTMTVLVTITNWKRGEKCIIKHQ